MGNSDVFSLRLINKKAALLVFTKILITIFRKSLLSLFLKSQKIQQLLRMDRLLKNF